MFARINPDSLDNLVRNIPQDTNYVRTAERYIWLLVNKLDQPKKADSLLTITEKVSWRLKDYKGLINNYCTRTQLAWRESNFDICKIYLQKAEQITKRHKLKPESLQKLYGTFCYYYLMEFDNENSLKYGLKAIKLTEKYGLLDGITNPYLTVAMVYQQIDTVKYKHYLFEGLKAAYRDTDSTQRYLAENQVSLYYLDHNQFDKGLYHAQKSLHWVERFGRKASYAMAWTALADVYLSMKKPEIAKTYMIKSMHLAKKIGDNSRLLDAYSLLGYQYFYNEGDISKSTYYYQECIKLAKITGNTYAEYKSYEALATIFGKAKDFEQAFVNYKKGISIKDSLFTNDWALKFNKLEIQQKETSLKLLETKNKNTTLQRNFVILGSVFLLIIFSGGLYVIVNTNRFKRFQEQQKLRNKLSSDLHDEIGSTLSSIAILSEMMAYPKDNGQAKSEIMQQVSEDARSVIDKLDDIIWTINPKNDEVQNLEARLKSFAIPLLESKGIDFEFDFSSEIEKRTIAMQKRKDVYLILKEAVNNVVKYSNCTIMRVSGCMENDNIIINVKDDGVGFDTHIKTQRNGLVNMSRRAEEIGGVLKIDSIIGSGTSITLSIPTK
jgi:two-component system, NarL family, sensor histidine kinase UhpB